MTPKPPSADASPTSSGMPTPSTTCGPSPTPVPPSVSPAPAPTAATPAEPEAPAPLRAARAHHARCRAAVEAAREAAHDHVLSGATVSASGADAEVLGRALRGHARDLDELPPGPLFFARIDFVPESARAGEHAGQRYHLGRRRVSEDPTVPPLVVDWRAPVARAFYRASPAEPYGLARRRRFGWAPGADGADDALTAYEDEYPESPQASEPAEAPAPAEGPGASAPAEVPGAAGASAETSAAGASADTSAAPTSPLLLAEIERPRSGPLRDIAATLQPEQDALVRAPLDVSVCVQGAPGTGKTAVGLHRVAYLLYAHPRRLSRAGVLVLGPNPAFLRHIAEVLPALGESGVRQSTLTALLDHGPARTTDPAPAARLKHDPRLATVLHRALHALTAAPGDADASLTVPDGSALWRVDAEAVREALAPIRTAVGDGTLPYRAGRERFRARLLALVRARAERRAGPRTAAWERRVAHGRPVRTLLDTLWPQARPEDVLRAALARPELYAAGLLDADACEALRRPATSRARTAADLVLLDEAAGLLAHPPVFGHIVVDEAQDLSPMECRAVARRLGAAGSLTVLGDLAQGTTPWAARDWPTHLAHLGRPATAYTELTTGYRVPAPVLDLASRLLPRIAPTLRPPRSLRAEPTALATTRATDPATLAAAVRRALERPGTVAVLCAEELPVRAMLDAHGLAPTDRLTVVPACLAKGLEFDHVVLHDPAAVRASTPRGDQLLYVALTRAVTSLHILHGGPSPLGASDRNDA
ncbi:putative ATP/GTP binding protein [Streptomyces sp. Tu6071]|uniref:HelD family protein n=1 Tax=Streptomyces sp. Tu6071 TaxID=355249 RepID=UPI00020E58FB|nr:ATP-binding domain-containing protein [Streptomyces sp. Tu6071]EGJ75739.1 putative ATP/GTP binding protein [Streptomyces sp. Tu6071]